MGHGLGLICHGLLATYFHMASKAGTRGEHGAPVPPRAHGNKRRVGVTLNNR